MVLAPRLELRQGQALVMTPQLQQAIKLLQLSNLELTAYVDAEMERNPLLEKDDSGDGGPATAEAETRDGDTTEVIGDSGDRDLDFGDGDRATDSLPELDADMGNVYSGDGPGDTAERLQTPGEADSGWSSLRAGQGGGSGEDYDFESTLTRERTLGEHLVEQLSVAIADPVRRMIGLHLIDDVNEAGYFAGDTAQIADRLGIDEAVVLDTLRQMQGFEPSGVLARTLAECLAIQLAEKDRLDPAMQALLDNIDLLARRDMPALMRLCGVDREDLVDMIGEIRELNPKPGLAFGSVVVQPVVPDVFVREAADGGWVVELNSETLPRVLVNHQYYTTVTRGTRNADEKVYLSECFANANWLVKSLDQRAKTILKVAREIVRQQDGFLAYGVQHLKPLNLKTIAEAISMHESTVSRVTSNKYIATPRGTFELKYFFTSAIASSAGGDAHSAESVRHRIKDLIDNETPTAVLSDDRIVELLRDSGIEIARRTVAKYREALHIPSSVQRRREKCEAR
jgi:RNA polymerase sigma-54 factor